jgi:hypothetical protein
LKFFQFSIEIFEIGVGYLLHNLKIKKRKKPKTNNSPDSICKVMHETFLSFVGIPLEVPKYVIFMMFCFSVSSKMN